MNPPDPIPPESQSPAALEPGDLALLFTIQRGSQWARAVACTVARRGVAFRLGDPRRAAAWLGALERLPFYKAGQFLFDLLEWEDFMLDGPPPPLAPLALNARSLQRIAQALNNLQSAIDGSQAEGAGPQPAAAGGGALKAVGAALAEVAAAAGLEVGAPGGEPPEDLPPLEAGFYLYQDVVLGVLASVLRVQTRSLRFEGLKEGQIFGQQLQRGGFTLLAAEGQELALAGAGREAGIVVPSEGLALSLPYPAAWVTLRLGAGAGVHLSAEALDAEQRRLAVVTGEGHPGELSSLHPPGPGISHVVLTAGGPARLVEVVIPVG